MSAPHTSSVDLAHIQAACAAVAAVAKATPVTTSAALSDLCGGRILLKAENLQRTGSFKLRGACNKLASLGHTARAGVVAGSAGNHAQALAFAARVAGVPCEIFVPAGASIAKMEACRGYGATLIEGGDSLSEAVAAAQARAADAGLVFCHPYDDPAVVAGQGTMGLELVDEIDELAEVLVPLGGGGLAAGTAIAVKSLLPHVRVVGVQTEACAPYVTGQAPGGAVATLADGIAVKQPGKVTEPLVRRWLDDIVVVPEQAIADAMMLLIERAKLMVEGAGVVAVAALMHGVVHPAATGATCAVLSGGNVDLGVLPSLIRRHETLAGRRLLLFVRISDRPGGLAGLLSVVASAGANIIEVTHVREGLDLQLRETGVRLALEVRNPDHATSVVARLRDAGFGVDYDDGSEAIDSLRTQ
jgi:threonine dehydratase